MFEPFANSGDPDQTPRSAASDLCLHCLPVTRLRVSSLQWVKYATMLLIPVISSKICELCPKHASHRIPKIRRFRSVYAPVQSE